MSLPDSFGAWEHLLKIIRNFHNWRVRDYFKHDRYDKHIREPRIDRPVNNLMQACIIGPNDSAIVVLVRLVFFEICLGNSARLQPGIYGLPMHAWDEYTFANRPEIFLFFDEDLAAEPDGFARVQAQIKFRLMGETPETITQANINALASRVKRAFGSIPTWEFTKGKQIYTYQDKKLGYWLQIYANTESDAELLIKKVLSIQNHIFDNDKFKCSTPKKESDSTPGSTVILGQRRRRHRYRPIKSVRFRYATLNIPGVDPIVLYDPYYRLNKLDMIS